MNVFMPYRVRVALKQLEFQAEKHHIFLNLNLPKKKLDPTFSHLNGYNNYIRSDIQGRDRVKLERKFLQSTLSQPRLSHFVNILLLKYLIITEFPIT